MKLYWSEYRHDVHRFVIAATEKGLCRVLFPHEGLEILQLWTKRIIPDASLVEEPEQTLADFKDQLDEYFQGSRKQFDIPLDLRGTAFQIDVWQELSRIPYGELRSYGDVARAIGRGRATRAVGAATGANPVPIVVPCHRVIGSSRALTGFRGGLRMKELLLEREDIHGYQKSGHARFDF